MKSAFLNILCAAALAVGGVSCISDAVGTSPSHQPEFSADTLSFGTVWAGELSPTAAVRVYNRHSDAMIISSLTVSGNDAAAMSLNVDGTSCTSASGVEIRANDSIFILAAVTPAHGGDLDITLELTVNGSVTTLPVSAGVMDPLILTDADITADAALEGNVRVFGALTVAPGAVLTLKPGTVLWLHDGAEITVNGKLEAQGTPDRPIRLRGDRTGFVAADIPYEIMSGQWQGITLAQGCAPCSLSFVRMENSVGGIVLEEGASLDMTDCIVTNSRENLITAAPGSSLTASGCAFTEAGGALLSLDGCAARLNRCTLANNYLFAPPAEPAIVLSGDKDFRISGSIVYRPGSEIAAGSLAPGVIFNRCMFGSKGSDDSNFVGCIWDSDPMFMLDLDSYIFDYRLDSQSPARGAGSAGGPAVDYFGVPASNPPALGAYN